MGMVFISLPYTKEKKIWFWAPFFRPMV